MKTIAAVSLTLAAVASSANVLASLIPGPDGWVDQKQCFDMCYGKKKATCFNPATCGNKTAEIGDYDYLLLDQLWQPQFCTDLKNGKDVTITYPKGASCNQEDVENSLTIHGLWPNYVGGYMGCCNSTTVSNLPLDPFDYTDGKTELHVAILDRLQKHWMLPVGKNDSANLCYTWNHEWQKHGYCGGWKNEISYFKSTLRLNKLLKAQSKKINAWGNDDRKVDRKTIEELYPKRIQLICSATEPGRNKLSAIRTCWSRREKCDHTMQPIDCEVYTGADNCNSTAPVWIASV